MPNTAQVLVIGESSGNHGSKLCTALLERGFSSADTDISQTQRVLSGEFKPDVLVLNMISQQADEAASRFVEFARTLKQTAATKSLPVIVVDGDGDGAHRHDMRNARVDDVLWGPLNELQLFARVNSLVRLNTMHDELVRRLNTSAKYGIDAPAIEAPPSNFADATVLVVGATESFPVIEKALSPQAALVGALTTATALDYLSRRDFDAVIIDLDKDPSTYLEMCQSIRRNSRLFNLPVILLAPLDILEDPSTIFDDGISDIIAKPIDQQELESRVASMIRELRFRDSLRAIYRQARHMATSDGLTGLYSRGFFLEHLANVISDVAARQHSCSLAYLTISNLAQINAQHGYIFGDRIIRQVGEMMGILVRGEDLTARYSGGDFCIILPDTPSQAADVAIRRITGVVKTTELAPPDDGDPVTANLIATVIDVDGTVCAEDLVSTAKARMS
jgi:diguanylate cyclase (GGDEF)-like protein